jgi:hypothetical protein
MSIKKKEVTGVPHLTMEKANLVANALTKVHKVYFSTVKLYPLNEKKQKACWAVTNKFDPNIRGLVDGNIQQA